MKRTGIQDRGSSLPSALVIMVLLSLLLSYSVCAIPPADDGSITNVIFSVDDVMERGQDMEISRSPMLVVGNLTLVAYSREIASGNVVCVVGSTDGGNTWSKEVRVHEHDHLIRLDLHYWKDGIYLFLMDGHPTDHTSKETMVFSAPIMSWKDIGKTQSNVVMEKYGMNFAVEHDDEYMYLSSTRSHYLDLVFYRFDGLSWEGPMKMVEEGYAICTTMSIFNGRLYLFYSRHREDSAFSNVDGHIRYFTSSDHGSSWSGPYVAMDVHYDLHGIWAEETNYGLIMFANRRYHDDIILSRFDPVTSIWTEEEIVVDDRGEHPGEGTGYDFSVRVDNDLLVLVYETSEQDIKQVHSTDAGERWLPYSNPMVLPILDARDPCLSRGGGLLGMISGSNDHRSLSVYNVSTDDLEDTSVYPPLQEAIPEDGSNPAMLTVIVLVALIILVLIILLIPLIFFVVIISLIVKGTRPTKGGQKIERSPKRKMKSGPGRNKQYKKSGIIDDDLTGVDREEDIVPGPLSYRIRRDEEKVGNRPRELTPPPI